MSGSLDSRTIKPGKYRHFKGNDYQVSGTVYHSETEELMVLYQALYGDKANQQRLWVRPYDLFTESIERNGKRVLRFERIAD